MFSAIQMLVFIVLMAAFSMVSCFKKKPQPKAPAPTPSVLNKAEQPPKPSVELEAPKAPESKGNVDKKEEVKKSKKEEVKLSVKDKNIAGDKKEVIEEKEIKKSEVKSVQKSKSKSKSKPVSDKKEKEEAKPTDDKKDGEEENKKEEDAPDKVKNEAADSKNNNADEKPKEDSKVEDADKKDHIAVQKTQMTVVQQQKEMTIEPKELRFDASNTSLEKITFTNHFDCRMAIKIKCSDNDLFRLNPVFALIEKDDKLIVEVSRLQGNPKADKLAVVYTEAPDNATDAQAVFKGASPPPPEKLTTVSVPLYTN